MTELRGFEARQRSGSVSDEEKELLRTGCGMKWTVGHTGKDPSLSYEGGDPTKVAHGRTVGRSLEEGPRDRNPVSDWVMGGVTHVTTETST